MKKFTLVELLIVIGIFSILLTLLIPSLSKAQESAKAVLCASNQAQVYRGGISWSKKYNGWLPFGWRKSKDPCPEDMALSVGPLKGGLKCKLIERF